MVDEWLVQKYHPSLVQARSLFLPWEHVLAPQVGTGCI
jgi:hypothetical protein